MNTFQHTTVAIVIAHAGDAATVTVTVVNYKAPHAVQTERILKPELSIMMPVFPPYSGIISALNHLQFANMNAQYSHCGDYSLSYIQVHDVTCMLIQETKQKLAKPDTH